MDFEFDKEMDFLLRDHATRASKDLFAENAPAKSAHLDADDLAAFAENVLPQNLRLQFAAHLADCGNCRQTLSGLMLINEAAEAETSSTQTVTTTEPARATWLDSLRRLFAFPALTYATAGLAVLLVGTIAFIAFQNQSLNQETSVARFEPTEQAAPQIEQPTAPAATTSAAKPEQMPVVAPEQTPNAELQTAEAPAEKQTETSADSSRAGNLPSPSSIAAATNPGGSNAAPANTTVARSSQPTASTNPIASTNANIAAAPRAARSSNQNSTADKVARPTAPQPNREDQARRSNESQESEDASGIESIIVPRTRAAAAPPPEKRTVANKTFEKRYDVWQDSTYKSQSARLVLRGSKEYKKLDAGLRQIADKLSGEVIIVWQGKAYKIR